MYKGYKVRQVVLHAYSIADQTAIIVDAPAGCRQCQEQGWVVENHPHCGIIPEELMEDPYTGPHLEHGWGWIMIYSGPDEFVDEWLRDKVKKFSIGGMKLINDREMCEDYHPGLNEGDKALVRKIRNVFFVESHQVLLRKLEYEEERLMSLEPGEMSEAIDYFRLISDRYNFSSNYQLDEVCIAQWISILEELLRVKADPDQESIEYVL